MKLFIAAMLLLALLFSCVLLNTKFVTSTIDQYHAVIQEKTDAKKGEKLEAQHEKLSALWEEWQQDVRLLSLTVNHADLMVVEEKFAATIGAAAADAYEDYMIAREQLLYSLLHLKEMGEVRLGNIF